VSLMMVDAHKGPPQNEREGLACFESDHERIWQTRSASGRNCIQCSDGDICHP
jgi:hypothetical protein